MKSWGNIPLIAGVIKHKAPKRWELKKSNLPFRGDISQGIFPRPAFFGQKRSGWRRKHRGKQKQKQKSNSWKKNFHSLSHQCFKQFSVSAFPPSFSPRSSHINPEIYFQHMCFHTPYILAKHIYQAKFGVLRFFPPPPSKSISRALFSFGICERGKSRKQKTPPKYEFQINWGFFLLCLHCCLIRGP